MIANADGKIVYTLPPAMGCCLGDMRDGKSLGEQRIGFCSPRPLPVSKVKGLTIWFMV